MKLSKHDVARFWSKVNVSDRTSCWEWTGSILPSGYGEFSINHRNCRAHRIAYEFMTGEEVPEGMSVCHSCDNPKCVNPSHLWVGTHIENMRDMDRKGRRRAPRGTERPNAILNEDDVREIRRRYETGRVTHLQMATEYGVHKTTITRIVNRQNWKWLE